MQTLRSRYKTVQGKWSGLNWRSDATTYLKLPANRRLPVALARLNTSLFRSFILASGDKCVPAAHAFARRSSPIRAGRSDARIGNFPLPAPFGQAQERLRLKSMVVGRIYKRDQDRKRGL